jgi:glycosyltransferase involved in cell wall biosynthesis
MSPLCLLLVTQFALPARGGIERFLDDLLSAWVAAGNTATAIAPAGSTFSNVETRHGNLFAWRWMRPSYLPLLWQLPRWAKRANADFVLFGHASNALAAAALLSPFGFRYGVIAHGMDVRRMPRWLARATLNAATTVFANSSATAAYLRGVGVRAEPVLLTPGVAVPKVTSDLHEPRILFVGRLVPRKGLATLIRALKLAVRAAPHARLTVVGDGPDRGRVTALAAEIGVGDRVEFLGSQTDTELADLRRRSACAVLVPEKTEDATDVEGYGMVLAEAQAAGIPAVTVDQPGVREAVAPEGALFVPPKDPEALAEALVRILTDSTLRERMAGEGRRWALRSGSWNERARLVAAALAPDLSEFGTISVVIPAFNAERTLTRTIASVRAQRGVTVDSVVVDDGSTDGTVAVAKSLGAHLVQQPNRGAPAARNHGARQTTGQFLFFCDADVKLNPNALQELLRSLLTHPHASYAYCSFRFGVRTHRCGPFDPELLRRRNYITTMSLIRRGDFPGFDESIRRLQDWDLWLTMLDRGSVGTWVPKYLFTAIPQGGGISGWLGAPPPPSAVQRILDKHALHP